MFKNDPGNLLLSFNKSNQVIKRASTKPSTNKSPSNLPAAKSRENNKEKKKPTNDNWKIKQILYSVSSKNSKLKQKLSQRSTSHEKQTEVSNNSNNSNLVDFLQNTIKNLKNDLKKKNQENNELKKRLLREGKEKDSKFNTPFSYTPEPNGNNKERHDRSLMDFNRDLSYLQSEIEITRGEKQKIETAYVKLQERFRVLEKKNVLQIEKLDPIFVLAPMIDPTMQTKLDFEGTMELDQFKILRRENLKNVESNVFRYFKSFFMELSNKNLDIENIVKFLEKKNEIIVLEVFLELIKHFGLKLNLHETRETFKFISKGKPISRAELIETIQYYSNELDSSKSSDISSGSYSSEKLEKITEINKAEDLAVGAILDNISMTLFNSGINKHEVLRTCQEKLPEIINFESLLNFFIEQVSFIKDCDQALIATSFMEGHESREKNKIIQNFLSYFFTVPEDFIPDSQKYQETLRKIQANQELFLDKCRESDRKELGRLNWEVLHEILKRTGLLTEESLDFKYFCFSLDKDLNKIPYYSLLECRDQGNKNKFILRKRTMNF